MKKAVFLVLIFSVYLLLVSNSFAQTSQTEQPHISQLKNFYEIRDFEGGYQYAGKNSVETSPNMELQAWFVMNFADYESSEAVIYAKDLSEKNKENAWAEFAYAHALRKNWKSKDALQIAEKILKIEPENEDFIFLKVSALLELDNNAESLDFLLEKADFIKNKPKFFRFKGETLFYKSKAEKDQKADDLKKESFESFAEAQKIDPKNVDVLFFTGLYLNREKRFAEAEKVLKTAITLSPKSDSIRREFWKTIIAGQTENIPPAKLRKLDADIKAFLKLKPNSSKAFDAVYQTYRDFALVKQKEAVVKKILTQFSDSSAAENLLAYRIFEFSYSDKDGNPIEKKRAEAVKMQKNFLNRPKHFNLMNLEAIYSRLFHTIKDYKPFSNEELLKFAEKSVNENRKFGSQFFPSLVYALIERNLINEAEIFAGKGIEATEEDLKTRYDWAKDELMRENFEKRFRHQMLGAFGKVLSKQKKYDEAEPLLIKSESFQTLGEMYVEQNKWDKAEDAYISHFANAYEQEKEWKVIKDFYEKRNGNLDGYDKFEEKVRRIESEKRREKIIAEKVKTPKDVVPFDLKDLKGKPINFADYKGKIVIVNIWGTWCQPCVIEMPEFQQLHKKYATDKDVAILTIAEDEIEPLKKFMIDNKYDFPVMIDSDVYLSEAGINVFPTTWFIDKNGKISYIKIGSSPKLLEEFSWRIEALR